VLESVAFEYAWYLAILREVIPGLALTEARAIGGGARSPVWNQIKADVLGVPYQSLSGNEFGSWGSAMIAGKAAGIFEDLAAVATEHAQPAGAAVQPDPERHAIYAPLAARYAQWQATLAEAFVT
jgi:xylulokinase